MYGLPTRCYKRHKHGAAAGARARCPRARRISGHHHCGVRARRALFRNERRRPFAAVALRAPAACRRLSLWRAARARRGVAPATRAAAPGALPAARRAVARHVALGAHQVTARSLPCRYLRVRVYVVDRHGRCVARGAGALALPSTLCLAPTPPYGGSRSAPIGEMFASGTATAYATVVRA